MKLRVLVDNNTIIDDYYLGEPALSFYIEDEDEKILFDTGYSNVYMKNAKDMQIELKNINKLVISHGHNDHTGGLYLLLSNYDCSNIELVAHPNCFEEKYCDGLYIGSPLTKEEISKKLNLHLTNSPIKISKNIIFLGEIPETFSFEKRRIIGTRKNNNIEENDYVTDDSALVYKSDKGLFIITGCSHSGVCNIIEYAKKVCNCNKVYGVIGGFHLFAKDKRLKETIKYFKDNEIEKIYPCHCVSLLSKIEMGKILKILEVGVGLEIEI